MTRFKIVLRTACLIGIALSIAPTFSASAADDGSWLRDFFNAKLGCSNLVHLSLGVDSARIDASHRKIDRELFGKPILQWSEDDISTSINIHKECVALQHTQAITVCVRGNRARSDCERNIQVSAGVAGQVVAFERQIRNLIVDIHGLDDQRKAQLEATARMERAEENAKREKEPIRQHQIQEDAPTR